MVAIQFIVFFMCPLVLVRHEPNKTHPIPFVTETHLGSGFKTYASNSILLSPSACSSAFRSTAFHLSDVQKQANERNPDKQYCNSESLSTIVPLGECISFPLVNPSLLFSVRLECPG